MTLVNRRENLMDNTDSRGDLKAGLRTWAEEHQISPADFARMTGYSYNHAYQLLRGEAAVTDQVIGRITVTYGPEAAAEILKEASADAGENTGEAGCNE